MSLGCARCGDCCTDIHLPADVVANLDELRAGKPLPAGSDPSYLFILDHWSETKRGDLGATHECDQFDPNTRMCLAHEDRPPVCVGFPFYRSPDGEPTEGQIEKMPLSCSYALDIAPERRREGARPLIPLTVVRHAESRPRADHEGGSGQAAEVTS